MLAFVLNSKGCPLMPCKPQRARKLLEQGKARVVSKLPFLIKLKYGSSNYKQDLTAGMDTGSKTIGTAVVNTKGEVLYQAETTLRAEEIKKKIPTGKIFGLRKFDLVKTVKGCTGFIKGKRSTGFFSLGTLEGKAINNSVNVKKGCKRIAARKTILNYMRLSFDEPYTLET